MEVHLISFVFLPPHKTEDEQNEAGNNGKAGKLAGKTADRGLHKNGVE